VTLKDQGRDPNILVAQYLENGWRYSLGSNGPPMGMTPSDSNGYVTDDVT